MSPLIAIGFVAFLLTSFVVGVRLLWLAKRTRELPELLIGIGVLGIGPVGFGGFVGAGATAASHPSLSQALFAFAFLSVAAGVVCKAFFNARVYHAGSAFASSIWIAVALFMAGVFGWRMAGDGLDEMSRGDAVGIVQSWLQIGVLLWGSVEALIYWHKMRLRLRLGLADPVVANRFLMWAIGAGAAGIGSAVGTVAQMVTGVSQLKVGWVLASSSAHGFVAAVALALAFVPPASYVQRIRARARATA